MRGMPLIEKIKFDTGSPEEDAQTAKLVGKLVSLEFSPICVE